MIPISGYGMLGLGENQAARGPRRNHLLAFMIRNIAPDTKLIDAFTLDAIHAVVPGSVVQAVVADLGVGERRRRRLPAELTILLSIAMSLFTHCPLQYVLFKLLRGLRLLWPDHDFASPTKSAISQARYRLGPRPLVELFRRVCRPMATEATQGAFLFGLRLMAIDSTTEDLPDTPENARVFGKPSNDHGEGPFPQVKAVYLLECGTHAIVDAGVWPCHKAEQHGARRLLRSVSDGMLLMWDSGLHSFEIAKATVEAGAHFLGRVPAGAKLKPSRILRDGSYLAYIHPSEKLPRRRGQQLLVRVIEYTLDDPARPGYGERHRLMGSLLDDVRCPALDLACAYHERWEIEITVDETDTHQRPVGQPLRSRKPLGVIQELYGLLIAHYVIRHTMHEAALRAGLAPDRLSFSNALRLICDAIPEFQMVADEHHPALYRRLLRDIAYHRLPERLNRINPRVVKRHQSPFPVKRATHKHWPQPSKPFREAVVMLN